MGKIKVLPEVLAHQIAAGEIVERPASVAKELLENALDAQARRIIVEVEEGGKRSISVCDDGHGMSEEDAQLAFQHHATSKIRSFDDLTRVRTLGFRGEALPSIASVCRLELRTIEQRKANGDSPLGTEVKLEGGVLQAVKPVSWPVGTEVKVEDLFFNVPARRKFLKTRSTELSHLSRQTTQYALAYPEVEFQLSHNQRLVFHATCTSDLQSRIYQLLGEAFLESLVPVKYEKNGIRVSGWTSLPHEQRSRNSSQFLYVNGRMVKDRVLTHAVRLAYQDRIPAGTYPPVILLMEMDPEGIDVNVHPCKTEIRFRDSNSVHRAVYHGIEEALLVQRSRAFQRAPAIAGQPWRGGAPGQPAPPSPSKGPHSDAGWRKKTEFSIPFPHRPAADGADVAHTSWPSPLDPAGDGPVHKDDIPETDYVSSVPVVLGQFVESFLVAADRDGVILVDQHVAHERILYDQALDALQAPQGCAMQRLLIPLTYELGTPEKPLLAEFLEKLNANGFEVEPFGPQTVVIKGVPFFAKECDARLLIQEILEGLQLSRLEPHQGNALNRRLREKIAISSSCRAAIKINTQLSTEKMQWLLDELFRCQNPFTCPHGRPIVLRMGIEEVLRGFKRI